VYKQVCLQKVSQKNREHHSPACGNKAHDEHSSCTHGEKHSAKNSNWEHLIKIPPHKFCSRTIMWQRMTCSDMWHRDSLSPQSNTVQLCCLKLVDGEWGLNIEHTQSKCKADCSGLHNVEILFKVDVEHWVWEHRNLQHWEKPSNHSFWTFPLTVWPRQQKCKVPYAAATRAWHRQRILKVKNLSLNNS
jgi:hypothetical protein